MSFIYEGRCSACNAVIQQVTDGYLAVYVDEPAPKEDVHPEDPRLVILAPPIESLILEAIGFTIEAAEWGGRLVAVDEVFCRECGRPFEIRRLIAGSNVLGCGAFLGLLAWSAAAGLAVGWAIGRGWLGWIAGAATYCATGPLLDGIANAVIRRIVLRRYADRAARVATPTSCPGCGSRQSAGAGKLRGPIPCKACGRRAVRFRSVAET